MDLAGLLFLYSYLQSRILWDFVAVIQAAYVIGTSSSPSCLRIWYKYTARQFHSLLYIMKLVFGWRRRRKVLYSFYAFWFCSLHCAVITCWTHSWWVWPKLWMLMTCKTHFTMFVPLSTIVGFPCSSLGSILYFFILIHSVSVRDRNSLSQRIKQEQNWMHCECTALPYLMEVSNCSCTSKCLMYKIQE